MNLDELKKRCLDEIDKNKEEIINVGKEIYKTPELGYKEIKSTKTTVDFFKKLCVDVEENIAVTGCKVSLNKQKPGPKVAVIGELDSIMCSSHKDSTDIGNIHACGHNIQIAGMLGCALGIIKSGVLDYLDGKIDFMAVPAEECIDLEFRKGLQEKNEIKYFGGKQELIYRGHFDDVDMAMMFHSLNFENNKNCVIKSYTNGFIAKSVTFIGKASHAGISPHIGINALKMTELASNNINALRDTFKDEDKIRISWILTNGGDVVNVVPSKASMEFMVRASNVDAMIDANKKINRAIKSAALTLGGKVIIDDFIGYLPMNCDDNMEKVFRKNFINLMNGNENLVEDVITTAGSTDFGDLSQILPCLHPWVGGVAGALHTEEYHIDDEELAYIIPAKAMAMTLIDLLYDKAKVAKEVVSSFKPSFTKDEYLKFIDQYTNIYNFDYTNE